MNQAEFVIVLLFNIILFIKNTFSKIFILYFSFFYYISITFILLFKKLFIFFITNITNNIIVTNEEKSNIYLTNTEITTKIFIHNKYFITIYY